MAESLKPDLCVIGAGPACLEAAALGAALGVSVVLVLTHDTPEEDPPAGLIIKAGAHAEDRRLAAAAGFPAGGAIDLQRFRRHRDAVTGSLAANSAPERFIAMGVRLIREPGRFTGPRSLSAGDAAIEARRFIVASARLPVVPEIEGLAGLPFLTCDTAASPERLPERLVLIGADPEGLALAQAFRRLGSEVVILARDPLLADGEPEFAGLMRRTLRAQGIALREGVTIRQAARKQEGVTLLLETEAGEEWLDASHILLAVGRRPDLDGLGLDAAGIARDDAEIAVDTRLRSSNPRVFAIRADRGHEAALAVRNALLRPGKSLEGNHIPITVRTSPELAWVGLSEQQARGRHGRIEVLRWPFSENRRAQVEGTAAGFVKAVTDRRGVILGAAIAGPQAAELIAPWTLAVSRGMTIREMSEIAMPPFSFSEASGQAARSYFAPRLNSLSLALALKFSRWLG